VFVGGLVIVVAILAIAPSVYLIENAPEIAREIGDVVDECERIVEQAFRKPQTGPIGDPFIPPLPRPQPTATPQKYSIALGHDLIIAQSDFPSRHKAVPYFRWEDRGIVPFNSDMTPKGFGETFRIAVDGAERIVFAVNGVGVGIEADVRHYNRDIALAEGQKGWAINNMTQTELYLISKNSAWRSKTEFYFVPWPESSDELLPGFLDGPNKVR
jgi:hypothetical protein